MPASRSATACFVVGRDVHRAEEFDGFSLSFTVADEAEADRRFNALADGGQVRMPLGKTFFSPSFGVVADRFGVGWMVYVEPKEAFRPA